ncbi:hypothetical protein S0112_033 [Shewanella phage S0112]|nr:hypothetical protein S0112_033 [Shewanella phage S0112]
MKPSNPAPAYLTIYPGLCEVARKAGYALAVHGSLVTYMDCVAVPCVKEAWQRVLLIEEIKAYLEVLFPGMVSTKLTHKPHGRMAVAFNLGNGLQIDLSIFPPASRDIY